ncbi:MAG: aminoglycoside phosphotransferase family protein [Candidatus Levybacteria bacterium]|nr:aminoglycoside phosphotransferase family protein [Candidatus Levybacteria bacterium]
MSTLKTKINQEEVLSFLQKEIDPQIDSVEFLTGGEMSQAFGFKSKNKEYVIRFFKWDDAFRKDKFAHDNYSSDKLPIPKVYEIDKYSNELFYCISSRAKGIVLDLLSPGLQIKMMDEEIKLMHAIHKTKVVGSGYGWWDENGNGMHGSWRDYVLYKKDEVYSNWEALYKNSFLKKEIIEKIYLRISQLTTFLPEDRYLVHADLGWSNEISDNTNITGVLDWGNSVYGDFLYDISFKHYWSSDSNFLEKYLHSVDRNYFNLDNADERIRCYMLHIGLGVLGFFALSNQKEKYDKAQKRVEGLLSI